MDIGKIVEVYTKIRDRRAQIGREFKRQDDELAEKLEKLEVVLLGHLNATNSNGIRTDHGTVYRQTEIIPSAADWQQVYAWIKATDGFDFLEKRIKRAAVTEYMDANEGKIPPGMNVFTRRVVRVRKD